MNTLGKYIETYSFLHRLDPRTKIVMMFVVIIAVLIPTSFIAYGFFVALIILGLLVAKLLKISLISMFKTLVFPIIFIAIFNLFLMQNGSLLFQWGIFKVYTGAVVHTIFVVLRLFVLFGASMLLTLTTKPMDITLALESLMKPLLKVKVPVQEIAMIISIALRFIPVFASEAEKIMKAQISRGIDFEHGKLSEKIKGLLSLIIPLFVSAFQKANDLAIAMEARGYSISQPRTRYRILKFNRNDIIFVVMIVCYLIITFGVTYAL